MTHYTLFNWHEYYALIMIILHFFIQCWFLLNWHFVSNSYHSWVYSSLSYFDIVTFTSLLLPFLWCNSELNHPPSDYQPPSRWYLLVRSTYFSLIPPCSIYTRTRRSPNPLTPTNTIAHCSLSYKPTHRHNLRPSNKVCCHPPTNITCTPPPRYAGSIPACTKALSLPWNGSQHGHLNYGELRRKGVWQKC